MAASTRFARRRWLHAAAIVLSVPILPAMAAPAPRCMAYVTGLTGSRIAEYPVAAGGYLSRRGAASVTAGGPGAADALFLSRPEHAAYVLDTSTGAVFPFHIAASGALVPMAAGRVPGLNHRPGAYWMAIDGKARAAYVLNSAIDRIAQYHLGPHGGLHPMHPRQVPTGHFPLDLALAPDGRGVYVSNGHDNDVSQYGVGPGGRLAPMRPARVAAGRYPNAIAARAVAGRVYVVDVDGKAISQFAVADHGGLKPLTCAPAGISVGCGAARSR